MRFSVRRTSLYDRDKKPIEEAERGLYYPPAGPDGWTFWWIEIKQFDELLELMDKYGKVVINPNGPLGNDYERDPSVDGSIEIYDDYRE